MLCACAVCMNSGEGVERCGTGSIFPENNLEKLSSHDKVLCWRKSTIVQLWKFSQSCFRGSPHSWCKLKWCPQVQSPSGAECPGNQTLVFQECEGGELKSFTLFLWAVPFALEGTGVWLQNSPRTAAFELPLLQVATLLKQETYVTCLPSWKILLQPLSL